MHQRGLRRFITFTLLFSAASAAAQPRSFRITQIEGGGRARLIRAGHEETAGVTESVRPGDVLVTAHEQTVYLRGNDATQLVLTGGTRLEITDEAEADNSVALQGGKVLGEVPKSKTAARYRFLIRTKAAAMGVRGTQFAVDADEKSSHFYVVEGVVDVAKSLKDLLTQNVVVAKSGQVISAASDGVGMAAEQVKGTTHQVVDTVTSGAMSLSAAMPFDVLAFVSTIDQKMPPFFQLPALTGQERVEAAEPSAHLSMFEIGGGSRGFALSWNPTLHLATDRWDLRGHIGMASWLADPEVKLSGTAIIRRAAFVELGPMARNFTGQGMGYGAGASAGVWFGDRKLVHLVERAFVGTNWLGNPAGGSDWEFRAGLGLRVF